MVEHLCITLANIVETRATNIAKAMLENGEPDKAGRVLHASNRLIGELRQLVTDTPQSSEATS